MTEKDHQADLIKAGAGMIEQTGMIDQAETIRKTGTIDQAGMIRQTGTVDRAGMTGPAEIKNESGSVKRSENALSE